MPIDKPWDIHPDLTAERLIEVANLILAGRNDALDRHDPSIGGDGWTLGCCAFAYSRHRILGAIEAGGLPWLTSLDRSMHFVWQIGEVPVRFYHGAAEEPNVRTLRQSFPELQQLQLSFEGLTQGADLAYRFAVETDVDGSVSRIMFVALDGDNLVLSWEIPLTKKTATLYEVGLAPAEGVDLPPPSVELPEHDSAEEVSRTSK